MSQYEIVDEDDVPRELADAALSGQPVQVLTVIGWIDVDGHDFRCGVTYRVKP